MNLNEVLSAELRHEAALTRALIERVEDSHFDFRPHPKSMALGGLLTHLSMLPGWGMVVLDLPEFDYAPNGVPLANEPKTTRAAVLAEFDASVDTLIEKLKVSTPETIHGDWTLRANGHALFTRTRVAVIREMIFNHMIHHRGQLSVYLRLLDIPVPSIYGPSADSK